MIPSPIGSTPFSVKDILNLEHHQIACSNEKDNLRVAADLVDYSRANYFGRIFNQSATGPLIKQELHKHSLPHSDYRNDMYEEVQANLIGTSAAEAHTSNLGHTVNVKSDQSWMSFDNMAETDHSSALTKEAMEERSSHESVLQDATSLQAAASTLLDFSQNLHNQTYSNNVKQAGQTTIYSGYYSPTNCFDHEYNPRMKDVNYDEPQSYSISPNMSQISYDKIKSEYTSSDEKTITTLRSTTHLDCDSKVKRFNSTSSGFCDDAVKSESTYTSSLTPLKDAPSEFGLNSIHHLSRSATTFNESNCVGDDLVEFASCSSRSPIDAIQNHSSNIDNQDVTSQSQEREPHHDPNNHVTGKF